MFSLAKDAKWVRAANYASGTASVKAPATGIDMAGYKSAAFILDLVAIAAGGVNSFKIQQSDTAVDDAAFVDITGASATTIADDDDDQIRVVEVRPTKRYVRGLLTKDASNVLAGAVICCLHNGDEMPATQPTGSEVTYVA